MTSSSFGTLSPTLEGYFVQDAQDALAIIQLVLEGKLSLAHRRPKDPERQYVIKSGNVFVFKEMKGHIQRWTDGVTWSASRILTPFLVYRQDSKAMLKTEPMGGVQKKSSSSSSGNRPLKGFHTVRPPKSRKPSTVDSLSGPLSIPMDTSRNIGVPSEYYSEAGYYPRTNNAQLQQVPSHIPGLLYHNAHMSAPGYANNQRVIMPQGSSYSKPVMESRDIDYELFGSLKDAHFAEDGLAKKTISVKYQGVPYRLISYFTKPDVTEGRLKRPSDDPMFRNIVIEKELWESVQENKTPLDMTELYYPGSAHLHGQYAAALGPMQSYAGYPPQQMVYGGGIQHELARHQSSSDSLSVYPSTGGEQTGGGQSRNLVKHPSLHGAAALTHNPTQQFSNVYQHAPPSISLPQQWYNENPSYRMPGGLSYGNMMRKIDDPPTSTASGKVPKTECDLRHPNERGISDLYLGGNYDDSARYPPPSGSALGSDTVPTSSSHQKLSQTLNHHHDRAVGYDSNESGQTSRPAVPQDGSSDTGKSRGLSDSISVNSQLEESLEEPSQIGRHQELLPSMSPGSSPLEPPIRTGISATTFIPQNYDYCDPEDPNDTPTANPAIETHSDRRGSQLAEYRPQYPSQSHGPPSATQSKASPNIYFSTGRAWS